MLGARRAGLDPLFQAAGAAAALVIALAGASLVKSRLLKLTQKKSRAIILISTDFDRFGQKSWEQSIDLVEGEGH